MFSGAQISLYPMADEFVGVILGALGALDPWRDRLRIERAKRAKDDPDAIIGHGIEGNLCARKHSPPRSAGITQISF